MQACLRCQTRCLGPSTASSSRSQRQLAGARNSTWTRRTLQVQAKQRTTGNAAVDNVIEKGQGFVESAANMVPESVPRPVAKTGVAVASVLLAFWVLQKLVSTVLTIALLGGAAWFYFQYGSGGSEPSSSSSKRDSGGDVDLDDPLAEARRIMDKYKK